MKRWNGYIIVHQLREVARPKKVICMYTTDSMISLEFKHSHAKHRSPSFPDGA